MADRLPASSTSACLRLFVHSHCCGGKHAWPWFHRSRPVLDGDPAGNKLILSAVLGLLDYIVGYSWVFKLGGSAVQGMVCSCPVIV